MANVTLESLFTRIKKEVAQKQVQSEKKKEEARRERANRPEPSVYQREEMWYPCAIHRTYEIQRCDCCTGKSYLFDGDKVELRHKLDKSARRWIRERGELMGIVEDDKIKDLPVVVQAIERVIPECWDCYSLGKQLNHLFREKGNVRREG